MEAVDRIEAITIGASAGGVEALLALLDPLPANFLPSILIVIHLPADRSSSLPRLFSGRCRLPVKEAEDKEPIEPGKVYIAPPGYHLLVEPEKYLSLSMDEPEHYSRPSIDLLFESAAYAYRKRLLGIILTGASADGSEGLRAVRQLGGAAWVQDPQEATSAIMPRSAVAKAGADLVLPLKELATRLSRLDTI